MANCADNSYVIYYTNLDKGTIQIQKSALIVDELDIALIGKTRLEYGEIFNENILHVLEHFACPEQPGNPGNPDLNQTFAHLLEHPTPGQIWYNKTQNKPYVYTTEGTWRSTSTINDVGGNSGVIAHGQYLPLPIGQDGYNFSLDECTWTVSPFSIPSEIDFMHCFTDPVARVTMQYRLEGDLTLNDGYANFQIVGIRNNVNLGTIDCQSGPAPTTTPLGSPTPTPTPTMTVTLTPTITPTVTVTATATLTPTPTMSNTPNPSLTPTPTNTPNPSITPTLTPTMTVTPTMTITPTVTVSPSFTPSVTPTTPFNDGGVFAVGVRPEGASYDGEAYYVRKLQMDNTFSAFTQTAYYSDDLFAAEPNISRVGEMMGDNYIMSNGIGLAGFDVNIGNGLTNASAYDASVVPFKPDFASNDGLYVYAGEVNYDNAPTSFSSQLTAYAFDGTTFAPVGASFSFANETIIAVHTISITTVFVVTAANPTSLNHTWRVLTFNGGGFVADSAPVTIPNGTTNIAVRDGTFIGYVSDVNELIVYAYNVGSGLSFVDSIEYAAETNDLNSMQFDRLTGKLFLAYTPIAFPTSTVVQCVVLSGSALVIEQSTTVAKQFATSSLYSISAYNNRVLLADIADPNNAILNSLVYNDTTGFTISSTIPVVPTGRPVTEVAFIIPNVPQPSPSPTPTVTPTISVTPTITPTISGTPTATPSVTPTVTPTITPTISVTPSITPLVLNVSFSGIIIQQGSPATEAANATGGYGLGTYVYTLTGGTLPTGMTLNTESDFGIISGTPTEIGMFTFTITVTSGDLTDSKEATIQVVSPPPP